jgi:hypothetical protein
MHRTDDARIVWRRIGIFVAQCKSATTDISRCLAGSLPSCSGDTRFVYSASAPPDAQKHHVRLGVRRSAERDSQHTLRFGLPEPQV